MEEAGTGSGHGIWRGLKGLAAVVAARRKVSEAPRSQSIVFDGRNGFLARLEKVHRQRALEQYLTRVDFPALALTHR